MDVTGQTGGGGGFVNTVTPTIAADNQTADALYDFYEICVAYVAPIFYIQGIVGNVFALVIFFKSKTVRRREIVDFLIPLALADLTFLIFGALINWLQRDMPHAVGGIEGIKTNILATPGACKVLSYIGWVGIAAGNWIVVLLTWERAVVMSAKHALLWLSRAKRLVALAAAVILSALLLIPVLVKYDIDDDGIFIECDYMVYGKLTDNLLTYLGPTLINVFVFMVPLAAVWIANTILVVHLCKKRRLEGAEEDDIAELTRRDEERKLVIQLIAIPTMFLIFTTPPTIFGIWFDWLQYEIDVNNRSDLAALDTLHIEGLNDFFSRLVYINNCLNWIVYIASLKWFREEARNICCPAKRSRNDSELAAPLVRDDAEITS
ncbi:apelin receptor-like [Tubulanus polymorphus]|uniref:apelin receptor-like n=1 Tax=Tubulanus polymorphus TaxID=672921 RepID=UPI003DA4F2B4